MLQPHSPQSVAAPPARPLQQLPAEVAAAVVALLPMPAKRNLRLTCKTVQAIVDGGLRQLTITAAGPFTAVPSRLPNVQCLTLQGRDEGLAFAVMDFVDLMSGQTWSSVSRLFLHHISSVAAAIATIACPNVRTCTVGKLHTHAQGLADFLRVTCRSLSSLTSLSIPQHALDDAAVRALGGCATLRHLDAQLDDITADGWASFLALPLTSLAVRLPHALMSRGVMATWASGMPGLTALTACGTMNNQPAALQLMLPTSLVSLSLTLRGHWRATWDVVSPLRNLKTLTLDNPVSMSVLAGFATSCPSLETMALDSAQMSGELHNTPFRALTRLQILSRIGVNANFQLAAAFPTLRVLHTLVECAFEDPNDTIWLHGLTKLEELIGGWTPDGTAYVFDSSHFAAMAALPRLNRLVLYPDEHHILSISSFGRLPHITWRFGDICFDDDLHGIVSDAFRASDPPEHLTSATFDFHDNEVEEASNPLSWPPDEDHIYLARGQDVTLAAREGVSGLLRAPALTRVVWVADSQGCGGLDDATLYALAAHPCVTHIEVQGGSNKITTRMLQLVRRLHACKGLTIVHLGLGDAT